MKLLLDTCCIVWAIARVEELSARARQLLTAGNSRIFVSPISAAEIACACERGRLTVRPHWKPWLRKHLRINAWQIEPIDLSIMEEAYSLPGAFHADPADRILTATARLRDCVLLTADRKVLAYPHVEAVW